MIPDDLADLFPEYDTDFVQMGYLIAKKVQEDPACLKPIRDYLDFLETQVKKNKRKKNAKDV